VVLARLFLPSSTSKSPDTTNALKLLYSHEELRLSEESALSKSIEFVKFDVDELPDLTADLGVRAMPTFFVFKGGNKVDELVGANPQALQSMLAKHAD
jgi:thiol-disulfide isomerase/thioredoxin